MDMNNTAVVAATETPATTDDTDTPPAAPVAEREAAVMAVPPRDILSDAASLTDAGGGRVITPSQEAQLAQATTPAAPRVNSGQFGAISPIPNEFRITHQGRDLGGKTLNPTEVPVVLAWLNSLPPD